MKYNCLGVSFWIYYWKERKLFIINFTQIYDIFPDGVHYYYDKYTHKRVGLKQCHFLHHTIPNDRCVKPVLVDIWHLSTVCKVNPLQGFCLDAQERIKQNWMSGCCQMFYWSTLMVSSNKRLISFSIHHFCSETFKSVFCVKNRMWHNI